MLLLWELPFPAPGDLYCQNTGYKYFKNHGLKKEYAIQPQNWDILQDKHGIIYIANNGGIIEFDGISWRLITIPNRVARSLAFDNTGTIYVGGKDEMGFLNPDSNGSLQYRTLLQHLKDNQKDFSEVLRTHWTKEGIYFMTYKSLFRWNPGAKRMNVWETDQNHPFKASFFCGGKYFIHRVKTGLMHIVKDSLKLVPGGEAFTSEIVYMMVPYDTQKLLIGTDSNGLYLYDGIKTSPFPTGVDEYLREKQISHGIRISCGDFGLATRLGGLVIIQSNGRLKEILTKDYGLLDDTVWHVFEDFQGNLWLALNKGISKIEYNSPITIYDDRLNLPGLVLSVVKHRNNLYAGTTRGLFFVEPPGKFRPISGIPGFCRSLLSIGDSILAATSYGIFQVKNNKKRRVTENRSYVLVQSHKDTNRIWVGTREGLVSLVLTHENGQWAQEHTFENITHEIHTIVEDEKGNLWLGTLTKGVLYVDFTAGGVHPAITAAQYDKSHSLPPGEVHVIMAANHVMFASPEKGIFRFDEQNKIFVPDASLGQEFAGGEKGRGVFRIVEDKNKNIWLHSNGRNIQAIPQPDGTFILNIKPFLRLPVRQVNTIHPDPDGDIIWFAGSEGLIRYDLKINKKCDHVYPTLIRQVLVNGKLVFDGYKNDSNPLFPIIDYKDRNLRFMFAAPFFEEETETKYRYLLEGYDDHWSDWTKETQKDYTNLDSGVHIFRVRAKNIYEHVSKEAVFQFKILPPWYKTWWAFSVYGLLFFLLVFLIVKWRSRQLLIEKQRLEQIVKDRTKEIEEKKQQLEEQSQQLKEMDKLKSRFFANISHEFRTPLTLIMGPLEQLLSQSCSQIGEKEQKKKMKMMLRNSQRLLNLINQLLDLSKLDSGKMKLQAVPGDIIPFIKGITASFEIAAELNELDLQFRWQEETAMLYFDPEKMEKIMGNLLSNAVKFTPPGGRVTVSITMTAANDKFPAGSLEISVSDTGIGISASQMPHIFDHFHQVDGSHEHKYKGSGIGLALTKELVVLHRGDIQVRSREGPESGTEFIVCFPMGQDHLESGEIADGGEPAKTNDLSSIYSLGLPEEEDETDMETEPHSEEGAKNIILIVEDSADARRFIRDSLEPLYTVVEAADGREGIEKAGEIIPDLIISDIMMPEVDGYELCRVLKKDINTSHVPIILLTAKASDENVIQGLETGADNYITKPFNTRMLLARIKNLIELRKQLHMNVDREMTLQPAKMDISGIDKEFMKELQEVLDANLEDPDFNVEDLGKKLYMSRATLYRKILALSGKSPSDYIRSHRLKRAAQLLKRKSVSITEVAFEVGFSSRTYFTKCFKKKFHRLPSEYQASES
jgi:signal transduction histidine kinase/DNA-binding NarL/FixJ family response regulator